MENNENLEQVEQVDSLERLREIAMTAAADLTKEDKDLIVEKSKELDLEFKPKARCQSCYADQAVLIWSKLQPKNEDAKYLLKSGVDVMFRGIRVNKDTLTDELAEDILAKGFASYLFEKVA